MDDYKSSLAPGGDFATNWRKNSGDIDLDTYGIDLVAELVDYIEPEPDEQLRQENTRRVFNNAKSNTSEETTSNAATEESIPPIKEIPEKSSLKITINNNEEVLRKGDEIIFNHEGESYSSKVYSINGDNIKVRYRRKSITIKPKDIKKIY